MHLYFLTYQAEGWEDGSQNGSTIIFLHNGRLLQCLLISGLCRSDPYRMTLVSNTGSGVGNYYRECPSLNTMSFLGLTFCAAQFLNIYL